MPNALRALWEAWKGVARRIGDVQARILLTLFYYAILGPFALVLRWRSDPLTIKPNSRHSWHPRDDAHGTPLEQARRQS